MSLVLPAKIKQAAIWHKTRRAVHVLPLPSGINSIRCRMETRVASMKALRIVLLGLAGLIIAGWTWRLLHPNTSVQTTQSAAPSIPAPVQPSTNDAQAAVLSRLADVAVYAPFFERLKAEFPGDYKTLVDNATAIVTKGGHVPNPERLMTSAVRTLRQSHGILASKAAAEPLTSLFAAQSGMVDALGAADPSMCTDFLYGGTSANFMAFMATHRDLLEGLAIATLAAISSGRSKLIDYDSPTGDDFDKLTDALKAKSLSDDEIAALLDGKTFDPPLPDQRLCEAGSLYLHILQTMPEDLRVRVYALSAQLLARS